MDKNKATKDEKLFITITFEIMNKLLFNWGSVLSDLDVTLYVYLQAYT